jgi:hypothetical protein
MKSDDCIFSYFFRIGFIILPSAPHLFRSFIRNCPNYRPCLIFRNTSIFLQSGIPRLSPIRPRRKTAPFVLSVTAYSIHLQLPCLSEAISATRNLRTLRALKTLCLSIYGTCKEAVSIPGYISWVSRMIVK